MRGSKAKIIRHEVRSRTIGWDERIYEQRGGTTRLTSGCPRQIVKALKRRLHYGRLPGLTRREQRATRMT